MPALADQWSQIPHELLAHKSRSSWSLEEEEPVFCLYVYMNRHTQGLLMQQQFTNCNNIDKMAQHSFGNQAKKNRGLKGNLGNGLGEQASSSPGIAENACISLDLEPFGSREILSNTPPWPLDLAKFSATSLIGVALLKPLHSTCLPCL